jgi:hypothetical protein
LITRSNLRNLIRLLCYLSVLVYNVSTNEIIVSFCLLALGCFVHYLTKGQLIRNVVMCNNGIYGVVRHPYYMANYLIDVSFCLLSGNPYLLLIYPFLFFWIYGSTLRKEEKFLAGEHNEPYIEYLLDVPQVFPDSYFTMYLRNVFSGFSKKRISRNEVSRILRFWSTAIFILFLHYLKTADFTNICYSGYNGFNTLIILIILVIILYIVSIFVRGDRKNNPL